MASKRTLTRLALGLALVGTLAGCTAAPGNAPEKATNAPAAVEDKTAWTEVEQPLTLNDELKGTAYFWMLRPGLSPYQDELHMSYSDESSELKELVLAKDGVIDLMFVFDGQDVSRYITKSYVTDNPKSTKEMAALTCEVERSELPQEFTCKARFSVPGNPGGTYYGVIETVPSDPENERYGPQRVVASVTIVPFGSEGTICDEIDGERLCNSLPKEK